MQFNGTTYTKRVLCFAGHLVWLQRDSDLEKEAGKITLTKLVHLESHGIFIRLWILEDSHSGQDMETFGEDVYLASQMANLYRRCTREMI